MNNKIDFTKEEIVYEGQRLFRPLKEVGWNFEECLEIASITLEINKLKKEQNAIILAHSYQTPEIMYGVGDFLGDSYGLSRIAANHEAKKIIFCSVHFMGETAKLLSPEKEILVPDVAGCSLADSITAKDVQNLRKKYPEAGFVCYINTTAAVKAECDVCCTSSNAEKIVRSMPQKQVVFLPDQFMGENLKAKVPEKEIILWEGRCIVHEIFTPQEIDLARQQYPDIKVLAHLECSPDVVKKADLVGSTTEMMDYIKTNESEKFLLITECGISDRVRVETGKKIIGGCNMCPFMKKISLRKVLKALKDPEEKMFVRIDPKTSQKARATIDRMFEIVERG